VLETGQANSRQLSLPGGISQVVGGQIEQGDSIALPGEGDGIAARPAADIQDIRGRGRKEIQERPYRHREFHAMAFQAVPLVI